MLKPKVKLLFQIILVLLVIILLAVLMPRRVVKEGYIYRTVEDVKYVDRVTQVNGSYLPASGARSISIYFGEKHNDLYNSLKATNVQKVRFEGKYYPFTIQKTPMKLRFGPKILLENLIESQVIQ